MELPGDGPELMEEEQPVMLTELQQLHPLLNSIENYLKSYWHDPRFALRYAIGFLQVLQERTEISEVADLTIQEIPPIESL